MVTLAEFERRLSADDQSREVAKTAGAAVWLPAQTHSGSNIGTTPTHTILVELKRSVEVSGPASLGPKTDRLSRRA